MTGSEVQSKIVGDTVGVYVRVSSLYKALHRLLDTGLIESENNYYWLTDKGWGALKADTGCSQVWWSTPSTGWSRLAMGAGD
jgi:DNA-binding PadR family transcriptional regulator